MLRLGVCRDFVQESIRFRPVNELSDLQDNVEALEKAIDWCLKQGIGCFGISSDFFNHLIDDVKPSLQACRDLAKQSKIRLVLHPNKNLELKELEFQGRFAELVGADVIKIGVHIVNGDKAASLKRFEDQLDSLSSRVLERLSLKNDEKYFSPKDLLPFCFRKGIPFCYDVHNHRILKDGMGIEVATVQAIETWNREPLLQLSSPKNGWEGLHPEEHSDYVQIEDFPASWRSQGDVTIEVEATSKELAVLRLRKELQAEGIDLWPGIKSF